MTDEKKPENLSTKKAAEEFREWEVDDKIKAQEVRDKIKNSEERKRFLTEEVKQVDLEKATSIKDLVSSFKDSSIQSREIGKCADIYEMMLTDEDRPTIFMGMAGALIAGGQRKVLRDMVKNRLVDAIVSTGAILYQDFYQAKGGKHYKGDPDSDDVVLRDLLINRIYDTYIDEIKCDDVDRFIANFVEKLEPRDYSTREFMYELGKEADDENSILYWAYKNNIPVFCPALCDSSIGIGLTLYYGRNKEKKVQERVTIDNIRDNFEILQIIDKSKKTSAIYLGGGVPKNWINDAIVMASYYRNREFDGHYYIFQITMDSVYWGALSGSTLKEAQSWGKVNKKATKTMAHVETTVALPLIVGSIMQQPELYKNRKPLDYKWKGNVLESIY